MTFCATGTAVLKITDGTDEVSLLRGDNKFYLNSWVPASQGPKGDGSWQDSPFADGRRLAFLRLANVQEAFDLKVSGGTDDDLMEALSDLYKLLNKAREYWTTAWQTVPVYLEVKGAGMSETSYAVIYDWRTPQHGNPFAQPLFSVHPVQDNFSLVLERGSWLSVAPGSSTCVKTHNERTLPVYGANLIVNGGFEIAGGGSTFSSWTDTAGDGAIAQEATGGHVNPSGAAKNAKLTSGVTRNTNIYQNVTVVPGTTYYLSFWHKRGAAGTAQYEIYDVTNAVDIYSKNVVIPASTASWQLFTKTFVAPPGCTTVRLYLWNGATNGNIVYFDDVTIRGIETYTATYGETETCNPVFVGNSRSDAHITDIFRFDFSTGNFSSQLQGHSADWLFPYVPAPLDPPAVGDCLYIGSDTSTPYGGPFYNIVFPIAIAQVNIDDIDWSYWESAGAFHDFTPTELVDDTANTVSFQKTGTYAVSFKSMVDDGLAWVPTTLNGITAYWIRIRINSVGAGPTPPKRATQQIYTASTAEVKISATEVEGDIPALMRSKLRKYGVDWESVSEIIPQHVWVATRSTERGAGFNAYINADNTRPPTGVSAVKSGSAALTIDRNSCTGYAVTETLAASGGAGDNDDVVTVEIGATAIQAYYGAYRLFCRCHGGASPNKIKLRASLEYTTGFGADLWTGEYVKLPSAEYVADMGYVEILSSSALRRTDSAMSVTLVFHAVNEDVASRVISIYDIVLMPVDEWCGEFSGSAGSYIGHTSYADVDGLSVPLYDVRGLIRAYSSDAVAAIMRPITNGAPQLRQQQEQTLWVMNASSTSGFGQSSFMGLEMFKVQRYLSLRGRN